MFSNTLGRVDAITGELHEIGTEGKSFSSDPLNEDSSAEALDREIESPGPSRPLIG